MDDDEGERWKKTTKFRVKSMMSSFISWLCRIIKTYEHKKRNENTSRMTEENKRERT